MHRLLLVAVTVAVGFAAEVCPPGGEAASGGRQGVLTWNSSHMEVNKKQCLVNEVRNTSGKPLPVFWAEAGIQRTVVQDRVEVAVCCFDGEAEAKSTLGYGLPSKELPLTMRVPAGEGLAHHQEGYPDLIEGDARVRTVGIRGTLRAGDESVRVDLILKCSASQFAKQFAYQFSVTDRSPDVVEVEWNLLNDLRARMTPSVQPIPRGKTYIFLSNVAPREAEAVVELKTKSGRVAGRFRFDGFTAGH